ncbi:MAG: hypothetical protein AVDCRST_MAG89-2089 [uncultured Gemmatimonadetes bacterium]|uniref:RagB/SusD domain-containing protein n=1 Tax=uncultured Gemmatimonadota bacterium TaxID=203437 RepID=A0A6J4LD40_9BACT|nr:MAG: hypothetical protein AVDCRST_MAG89-2089 [uncultured Gemmatimonadota bacterium]
MIHGTRRRFGMIVLGIAAAAVALGACDSGLDPEAPGVVAGPPRHNPAQAAELVAVAVADFECALGAYIVVGGLLGEELIDATETPDRWTYDRRDVQGDDWRYATSDCESLGVYWPLSTARRHADEALESLEVWTDEQMPAGANRTRLIARAAAYAGYSYVLLGEGFCSAAVGNGPEMFPADFFRLAEQRFSRAIAAASAGSGAWVDSLRYMALVGRARVRLNGGNLVDAAADAVLVPSGFLRNATAAAEPAGRQNRVFEQNSHAQAVSIGPSYRNLTVPSVYKGIQFESPDGRVVVVDSQRTAVDGTRLLEQRKYRGLDAPLPIATWTEARLIEAEVALRQGNLVRAANLLGSVRTTAALWSGGIGPATVENLTAALIEERRRELFLEGHRLYDVRRLNLELQPATGTAYPKGGVYGDTRCLPMPHRPG